MRGEGSDSYRDEAPDITVLWNKRPIARKAHLCDCCNEAIEPGTRYSSIGVRTDGVFEHLKTHAGAYRYPSGCPTIGAKDRADEAEQFERGYETPGVPVGLANELILHARAYLRGEAWPSDNQGFAPPSSGETEAVAREEVRQVLAGVLVAWNEFYSDLTPQEKAESAEFGPFLKARWLLGRLLDPPTDNIREIEEQARTLFPKADGAEHGK